LQIGVLFFCLSIVFPIPKLQIDTPRVYHAYLRYSSDTFPVYSEHAMIVFPLSFGFSNPQYYYYDETARICPSEGFKPLCLVARLVFPVFDETTSRLESFQNSPSGIEISKKAYPKCTMATIRPGGFIYHKELMEEIDEWTGRRKRSRCCCHGRWRSFILYLNGSKRTTPIKKTRPFRSDRAIRSDHSRVIQLAKTILLIVENFQYSMNSVFDHFQAKNSKLGNQTPDLINSGELRMTLIGANTVQEMNRFSQLVFY
jgi:hypothetical protein